MTGTHGVLQRSTRWCARATASFLPTTAIAGRSFRHFQQQGQLMLESDSGISWSVSAYSSLEADCVG